jgi:hypothetical protein
MGRWRGAAAGYASWIAAGKPALVPGGSQGSPGT